MGEVRGAEALDMLSAMNTGHEGSLSTGHANSTEDMLSRIETMVLMGSGTAGGGNSSADRFGIGYFYLYQPKRGCAADYTDPASFGNETERFGCQPLFELQEGRLCRTTAPLYRKRERCDEGL